MNHQTTKHFQSIHLQTKVFGFFCLLTASSFVFLLASGQTLAAPANVRIIGDGNTHRAKVDARGNLAVTAQPKAPPTSWTTVNNPTLYPGGPSRAVLWSGIGRNKVSFTSLIASATAASAGSVGVYIQVYVSDSTSGDCVTLSGGGFGAAERFLFQVPVGQTVQLTWPSPLVLSDYGEDRLVCIDAQINGGVSSPTVSLFASGFLN